MISILEYVIPNRGVSRIVNPNDLTKGKLNIRKVSLGNAFPSIPKLNDMMGMDIEKSRRNKTVNPLTGMPKINSTGLSLMNRKSPPGTGFANVLSRRKLG
jgi:hypothetical protein